MTRRDPKLVKYLMLSEPDGDKVQYRCLEEQCRGIVVYEDDLAEHATKEHGAPEKDGFYVEETEIGFELEEDHPLPECQTVRCLRCNEVVLRFEAQEHAMSEHDSQYIYINLLV
jgi:hypothetical protein